jgi:cobalt-zinc-cadmium efflux system membrane fusion protein
MFADVVLADDDIDTLAVPKSAIQEIEGLKCVFVRQGIGFEKRSIETGVETEDYVQIKSGLKPNEIVATQGSLMLKTELTYRH